MINAEDFNRAMTLWFDLTGMDPDATNWRWEQIELRSMNDKLKESMKLDPTLITTYLLLDAYSTAYFKQAKMSVHEIDDDPDKLFDYMDKVREFKKLIRAPEIAREADLFIDYLRQALISYGVNWEIVAKFLEKRSNVAYIRLDALVSSANLRADHFLQGETDPEEIKPLYNPKVFGYWNVNSLINHVCGMPSGVSLNLIRDPDELHSYFIFAIRNGGNLITLTDIQEYAHPLGRYMSRRPDRLFAERAGQNWFPYQFLQIAFDEDGDVYHDIYRESQESGVVPHQPKHFTLADVTEMDIEQLAWLTLMFDRIVDRYWKQPIPPKALSYTNEMIKLTDAENPLLAAAAKANLPIVPYAHLPLTRLTTDDVRTEALDEAAVGKRREGFQSRYGRHSWMEERYGHLVPEEALNLLGTHSKKDKILYLEAGGKSTRHRWNDTHLPVQYDGEVKASKPDTFGHIATDKDRIYTLEKVDGTLFGPADRLDADRKFIARHNFAHAVQREADNEFEAQKKEVLDWYEKQVRANWRIAAAFAHHETVMGLTHPREGFDFDGDNKPEKLQRFTFSHLHNRATAKKKTAGFDRRFKVESDGYFGYIAPAQVSLHGGYDRSRDNMTCFINGAKSSFELYIRPGKKEDIALLAGVSVEELPELLQHWRGPHAHSYVGNSILDRIDPLEWAISNPWEKMDFSIRMYFSKSGFNKVMKEVPAPELEYTDGSDHVPFVMTFGGHSHRTKVGHSNWKLNDGR